MNPIDIRDLHRCFLSSQLTATYRYHPLRTMLLKLVSRFEDGQFYSFTLREVLRRYHGVHVGAYSYGACLKPGVIPAGVVFGRYCSVASGLRVFLRNHPFDRLSMHPFFYNAACGVVTEDTIKTSSLKVEHDAWIGEQVIITPGCQRIGIGAVVGAGAVVTKNVPDFAIVAGNPASIIRLRFPKEVCESILRSEWWNLPLSACQAVLASMIRPLSEMAYIHPLLARQADLSPSDSQIGATCP